jgi:hypothetical protein
LIFALKLDWIMYPVHPIEYQLQDLQQLKQN